jgi:hypothetical protein
MFYYLMFEHFIKFIKRYKITLISIGYYPFLDVLLILFFVKFLLLLLFCEQKRLYMYFLCFLLYLFE